MILKNKGRRILSMILCLSMSAALTNPYSTYIRKAEAFSAGTTIDEDTYLTENEIKDTTLLSVLRVIAGYTSAKLKGADLPDLTGKENLLSEKYSEYSKSSFTFGELKAYEGPIDLTPYADKISSIEGLGYARGASSFNIGACSRITSIPANEFGKCAMTEIILPSSLTGIGNGAFQQSSNLKRIIVDGKTYDGDGAVADFSNIKNIGDYAFDGCKSLDNITFNTSPLLTIGVSSFSNCSSLASVVLPMSNANNIGESAFSGCTSLTEVSFNDSLTYIPSNTFSNTSIKKVTITGTEYKGTNYMPAGIIYIGKNAFQNAHLSSLDFTKCSKLSYIDEYAFALASMSSLTLPEGLEKINSFAFNSAVLLSLNIPDSVNFLGTNVFRSSLIHTISMSPNITEIPEGTFRDCQLLSSITLRGNSSSPCRIQSIGDYAFKGCYSLHDTNFLSGASNLESIGEYAFSECCVNDDSNDKNIYGKVNYSGITDVTLPDNVTSIGKYAFYNNYSLETVNLGAGVKMIPQDAFSVDLKANSTPVLKKIILSNKLARIEDRAFTNNGYLRTIGYTDGTKITCTDGCAIFADSLKYIGNNAFAGCSSKQILSNAYNKNTKMRALEYKIAKDDIHSKKQTGDSTFLVYYKGNTDFSEVYINPSVLENIDNGTYILNEDTPSDTVYISAKRVWVNSSQAAVSDVPVLQTGTADGGTTLEVLDIDSSCGYTNLIRNVHIINEYSDTQLSDTEISGAESMYVLEPGTSGAAQANVKTITPVLYMGLKNVTLPDSLTDTDDDNALGTNVFANDMSLDTVDMSRNIKIIPDNTFNGCADKINNWVEYPKFIDYSYTGLNYVNNINNVTAIGDSAFNNCYSLKLRESTDGGEISSSLVNIGNNAFNNCKNIKSVVFHSALKTIGSGAFKMCSETNSSAKYNYYNKNGDKITYSYTDVLNPASANGLGLANIDFTYATKLEKIGDEAFAYNAVKVVNLPDALYDTVPKGLFRGCAYLDTITIPDNVTKVSDNSFSDCRSLTKLHIPATAEVSGNILTGYVPNTIPGLQMIVAGKDYKQSVPVGGSVCLPINCMSQDTRNGGYTVTVFENNDDTNGTVIYENGAPVQGDAYDDILDASIEYGEKGKPDRIILKGMNNAKKNIVVKVQTSTAFRPFSQENSALINAQTFTYNVDVEYIPATDITLACSTNGIDIISKEDASGTLVNSLYLYKGQNSVDLSAELIPANTTDKCIWSVDNLGIVSLELKEGTEGASGVAVTPLKTGNTKITVKCGPVTKNIYVYVKVPVTQLKAETDSSGLTSSSAKFELPVGGTDKIKVTATYDSKLFSEEEWDAYADTIIYSSDNENVVKVDTSGNIAAVSEGNAKVTVKALSSNKTIIYDITVVSSGDYNRYNGKSIKEITGAKDIYTGESVQLGAVLQPASAQNKVKWTVTGGDAVIDGNGLLTAGNTPGTVSVKATMLDANGNETNVVGSIKINVLQHAASISLTGAMANPYTMYVGDTLKLSKTSSETTKGYKITPQNSTDSIACTSSDESVVSVKDNNNNSYTITALKSGSAVITLTASSGVAASFAVNIIKGITGITPPKTLSVTKGSVTQLTPSITPQDSNDTIKWTSSNEKIVTVDSRGVITAHSAGNAKITATGSKGKSASVTVTVTVPAAKLTVRTSTTQKTLYMYPKSTARIGLYSEPADTTDTITYSSSNPSVAKVSGSGSQATITAVKKGSVQITAASSSGAAATITVKIVKSAKPAKSIKISGKSYVDINGTTDLTAKLTKKTSTDSVTWSSSNNSVAKVDAYGRVTGLKTGEANITAMTTSGKKAVYTVFVAKKVLPQQKVKLSGKKKVKAGKTIKIKTKTTRKVSAKNITWTSSNTRVATVKKGRVKGVGKGTAIITAALKSGHSATVKIKVTK